MPPSTFSSDTGPSVVGAKPADQTNTWEMSYNGVTFGPLFETKISGKALKDEANRTTKYMEYTLTADGYVTLPAGDSDISPAMTKLRNLLTAQGGILIYRGRGFDLAINTDVRLVIDGGANKLEGIRRVPEFGRSSDVAWGPVPELLEFQPLGAGRSAKIQWKCIVRIPEINRKGSGLLQFTNETSVSYGEDCYSTLSIRGSLEIPLTRHPNQASRTVPYTADDMRSILEKRIFDGISLTRFRITRREFTTSRDKRTLTWDVTAEELPYMNMPAFCTLARGNYSVRPVKAGMGLVQWFCTLKATYTVQRGAPRRIAWLAFLDMMRMRMAESKFGILPKVDAPSPVRNGFNEGIRAGARALNNPFNTLNELRGGVNNIKKQAKETEKESRRVWLMDFSIDEGLYLDSKTITFSATWRLLTMFSHILLASGIWTKLNEEDANHNNLWATSVRKISGAKSWLPNRLDSNLDVVVDFGGPDAI